MTGSRELVPLATAERATVTIWNAVRMRPRTVLVTAALAIVTVGLVMNWSALVAAGVAPLLISALPCAIMCAEAVWWRCHRRIIADHLIAAGETVLHIMGRNHIEPARITEAARQGPDGTLTYPAGA